MREGVFKIGVGCFLHVSQRRLAAEQRHLRTAHGHGKTSSESAPEAPSRSTF